MRQQPQGSYMDLMKITSDQRQKPPGAAMFVLWLLGTPFLEDITSGICDGTRNNELQSYSMRLESPARGCEHHRVANMKHFSHVLC